MDQKNRKANQGIGIQSKSQRLSDNKEKFVFFYKLKAQRLIMQIKENQHENLCET